MCIMDNTQASQMFKPPKMTGFRDFPEGCGLNAATTDTTLKGIVQQSSKSVGKFYLHRKVPKSPTREYTKYTQNTREVESELTGHGYWKKRKFAIRSSPPKDIHIKRLKTESFSNEADGVQCSSDDVSCEDFDLQGKEKSESSEEYGVLDDSHEVSQGDFDMLSKVKVESNEKYGAQYDSNVVSREDFDLQGKEKVESTEEYGVLYDCHEVSIGDSDMRGKAMVEFNEKIGMQYYTNVVSRRDFDQRSKKMVESNGNAMSEKVESNEKYRAQYDSNVVPGKYFDLRGKEKVESTEEYGVLYDCHEVSPRDSDIRGKKKVESNEKNGTKYISNVVSRRDFDQRSKKKVKSNGNVTSEKVKKALGLFRSVCKSLEEEKVKPDGIKCTRIDFRAAQILKKSLKHISINKPIIGAIPGVEVNDQFLYRAELGIVGIHRPVQSGIDYLNQNGTLLATSVVASGGYANYIHDSDTLEYVGQGGRVTPKNKIPEHQVLQKGNLALKNSMKAGNPIRVLHKAENVNARTRKDSEMYTYDGLYIVVEYWHELGDFDKRVYKFKLVRLPCQAKLIARKNARR